MNTKLLLVLILFCNLNAQSIQADSINDGPNIFYRSDSLVVKYICEGTNYTSTIQLKDTTSFNGFKYDSNKVYNIPSEFIQLTDQYPISDKLFIVSDVHGQFDIFKKLLVNNNVIDSDYNWTFGTNQLVIVGDVLDRGDYVHEILLLIYKLEKAAIEKGGMVHFLLGNHEVMVIQNDLRYVHEKYFKISEILGIGVSDLYSKDSFWGRWLRSKNILTKIGPYLFVHGGIHPQLLKKYSSITEINKVMLNNIDTDRDIIKSNQELSDLFRSNGPIWYRGFFLPDSLPDVSLPELNDILNHFEVDKIIVGHTTEDSIFSSFDNKIINVDGGIKYGESGQALLIHNNKFYRVYSDSLKELLF